MTRMADEDKELPRLKRRVEELEYATRRSLPLMLCGALLFVPVFGVVAREDGAREAVATGQNVVLLHLIGEPSAHGGLSVTICVLTIITALTLFGAAALTLGQLRVPEPIREASVLAAIAVAGAIVLFCIVSANDGSGVFGTDAYQPRWTYVLVIVAAIWIGLANGEYGSADRPRADWRE